MIENTAEIKAAALKLMAEASAIHKTGSGKLALFELVSGFGELPGISEVLARRADVELKATSADGGEFWNSGVEEKLRIEGAAVTVPARVQGVYKSTPDGLSFLFDEDKTIVAKKMFVSAPLKGIRISAQEASVEVGGALGPMLGRTVRF